MFKELIKHSYLILSAQIDLMTRVTEVPGLYYITPIKEDNNNTFVIMARSKEHFGGA